MVSFPPRDFDTPTTLPDFALIAVFGAHHACVDFLAQHFDPAECVEPVGPRLAARALVAVNGAGLDHTGRQALAALARMHHAPPIAILLAESPQASTVHDDGFHTVYDCRTTLPPAPLPRIPLACDRRTLTGPFDVIGDVHGCLPELEALLARLDWARDATGLYAHPAGRTLVFLGDLVDRGPDSAATLALALDLHAVGRALWVPGNHDNRLYRFLRGNPVKRTHGLDLTLTQLDALGPDARAALVTRFMAVLPTLPAHLVLAGGALVAVHAAIKAETINRESPGVMHYALYGATTSELDAQGRPMRLDWAAEYTGTALVVYGHQVVPTAAFRHNTLNLDQGAVFGGHLSALRYPERELISVPARQVYFTP